MNLVALMTAVKNGTLDAHDRADLSPDHRRAGARAAAGHYN